jgi:hypothetical protein
MLDKTPKKGHNQIFKEASSPPLDSTKDRNNNILRHPIDIAKEIHAQQIQNLKSVIPLCQYQNKHNIKLTCAAKQYLWHDIDGFTLGKRGNSPTPLHK